MTNTYRKYVADLPLQEALWWFIENMADDDPERQDIFFDLRERYRVQLAAPTPFKTTILWGSAPEPGDESHTFSFNTQAELDAFLYGVDEANGWMDWRTVEEGYVVPPEGFEDSHVTS